MVNAVENLNRQYYSAAVVISASMRVIKLMADYQCYPLWEASSRIVGNIDPEELPISERLREDLARWAECYDNTLNLSNPAESGFPSDSAREDFRRKGLELGERLRNELGDGFAVEVKVWPEDTCGG